MRHYYFLPPSAALSVRPMEFLCLARKESNKGKKEGVVSFSQPTRDGNLVNDRLVSRLFSFALACVVLCCDVLLGIASRKCADIYTPTHTQDGRAAGPERYVGVDAPTSARGRIPSSVGFILTLATLIYSRPGDQFPICAGREPSIGPVSHHLTVKTEEKNARSARIF